LFCISEFTSLVVCIDTALWLVGSLSLGVSANKTAYCRTCPRQTRHLSHGHPVFIEKPRLFYWRTRSEAQQRAELRTVLKWNWCIYVIKMVKSVKWRVEIRIFDVSNHDRGIWKVSGVTIAVKCGSPFYGQVGPYLGHFPYITECVMWFTVFYGTLCAYGKVMVKYKLHFHAKRFIKTLYCTYDRRPSLVSLYNYNQWVWSFIHNNVGTFFGVIST
jgi:hypothetical protein